MTERPLGIQGIEALYEECRTRVQDNRTAPPGPGLPAIVLVGPHGSGKTSTLKWLGYLGSRRPHVYFDFGSAAPRRPHEVAGRLAYGLSHRLPRQTPLLFPRLTLGLFVVAPELFLNPTDPERARKQLRQALRGPQDPQPAADRVVAVAGLLQDLNLVRIPGISLLASLIRQPPSMPLRVTRHTGFAWYAGPLAAMDALVELNQLSKSEDPADRAAVDRRLCEAFLADLRGEYARRQRDRNCVVLLDNIDAPGGREFLDLLMELRDAAGEPDPLLALAAASNVGRVPGMFATGPAGVQVRSPEQAGYADWERSVPDPPPNRSWRWYCVQLRGLTAGETAQLGTNIAARLPEAPLLAHRLTDGHPWSVRQLLTASARIVGRERPEALLRAVLSSTTPSAADADEGPSLEAEAREYLLRDLTDDQRRALVECCAAREFDAACDAGLLDRFQLHTRDSLARVVATRLWLTDPVPQDAETRGGRGSGYLERVHPNPLRGGSVLHPWLRLLLLRELAAGPDRWTAVHGKLRTWHIEHGHPLEVLYHSLALHRVDDVIEHLAQRLVELSDTNVWLYELYTITAAPLREAVLPEQSATLRAEELAAELAPRAFAAHTPLTLLVISLWLASDPRNRLPDANPELNRTINAMFQDLAMRSVPTRIGLMHEAAKYV
ncbi:hypothetical protein HXP44_09390 [Streptomyces sioyaensis]|uniref:Uncharacterized protein n=1 Tax=Streptomyces sioyaensis TaxID=67364 RepID=A0A4Q1QYN6_9ACTN|nr:hypothetical protein [Streptomyces sioyaensis]MBM4792261.1 hypothetical protein [Streptomyces sioyaensis]RXS67595.1 hypothetical protein EST54_11350 [Streptomyces sioyaensis]